MTSIRQRLTRRLLLAVGVPIVAASLAVGLLIRNELIEQFDAAVRSQSVALASAVRVEHETMRIDAAPRFMRAFEAPDRDGAARDRDDDDDEGYAFFQIWHADGATLARSESLAGADLPFSLPPTEQHQFVNVTLPRGVPGRGALMKFRPTPVDRTPGLPRPDVVVLAVATSRRDLDRTIDTVALGLAGCCLLVLTTTLLLVPRVVTREFAPIAALADQAGRITADSLDTRFDVRQLPAELAPIGARLNDLLGRLEASFERERRFSADLAHELRTPIAELRSQAEVALKWPESRAATADRDTLEIAAYMESIVTRLLTLARNEGGQFSVASEPVAVNRLLAEIWAPLAAAAETKSLTLANSVKGADIISDPVVLKSILTNLLQNAVDYTPAGGQIQAAMIRDGERWELRIANDVEGLTDRDLAHLFERFWRRDEARTGSLHAGLGLPLARSLAQAIGAELDARLETPTRLTFTLRHAL